MGDIDLGSRGPLRRLRDHEDEKCGKRQQYERHDVGSRRVQPIKQAAEDRAENGGCLPGRRIPGDRIGKVLLRHEVRPERLHRRPHEGTLDAEYDEDGENQPG
ncbi:hypothetical protein D3C87_1694780 [compost metagenome]